MNSTHTDVKKTGGLYGVKDVLNNAPSTDDVWFDYYIKVEGKHIVIKIDGKTTVDYNEPADWDPAKSLKNMNGRKLSTGHDRDPRSRPKSPSPTSRISSSARCRKGCRRTAAQLRVEG